MANRIEKVNELLKEELSVILHEHILSEEDCLVTITEVVTAEDLRDATVWISVLGKDVQEIVDLLSKRAWDIRKILKKRDLVIRILPNLHFKADRTAERAARVDQLLGEIVKEKE